jgi:hypothetical protein
MVQTTNDTRYSELFQALRALSPEAAELVGELDEVVGERLGEAEVTQRLATMADLNADLEELQSRLDRFGPLPAGRQISGRCGGDCGFEDEPWHDEVLAELGGAAVLGRLQYGLLEVGRADWLTAGGSVHNWEDIARFIRFHGWHHQVGMSTLAETLERLSRFEMKDDKAAGVTC